MSSPLIIFTDLDGTLLNSEDYRYDAAIPMVRELQARQIPVIPVTSKTRREVETLRQELALNDPFIVENGSGVFISREDNRFTLPIGELCNGYHRLHLGCTYAEARQGLREVARALGEELRGFGDLSGAEIEQRTGLPPEAVKQAQAREFTEPFVTPKRLSSKRLEAVVQRLGFRVVVGDRFSHLIGGGAGKGKALKELVARYQAQRTLTTVGLGNSPNDLEMLEAVDIPVIVPGKQGAHPGLAGRGWQVAPAPGALGWGQVVREICDR